MRIVTRRDLRDYFDHIGHVYGQDPMITYERTKFKPLPGCEGQMGTVARPLPESLGIGSGVGYFDPHGHLKVGGSVQDMRRLSFVVAAMWVMPIISGYLGENGEPLDPEKHDRFIERDNDGKQRLPGSPPNEEVMKEIIRAVGAPIFRVWGLHQDWSKGRPIYTLVIDENVPNLGELGFAATIPPGQMWQEIYSVMSNVLRRDPDKEPPCQISNADKIHTHGFNDKSFKHPTNLSKLK